MHSLWAFAGLSFCFLTAVYSDLDLFRPEDICDNVICAELDESECDGGYIKHEETLCGCGVCVKYVDKDGDCTRADIRVECKAGLKCAENGTCGETKCESDIRFKQSLMKVGNVSTKSWLPVCTPGGLYRHVQFTDSKAICVDDNGRRIFGQERKEFTENMTCACSYYLSKKKLREKTAWANGPVEHCTPRGDYDSLQCVDDLCYCADKVTGKHFGLVTHIKHWKLLSCYDATKYGERYETTCEREMFRINSIKHQFTKKGIHITGISNAECEPDGTFAPKQCLSSTCYCVDEKGSSFDVYKAEKDRSSNMNCRCAKDQYFIQIRHAQYPNLRCDGNGNYFPLQLIDQEYFCSDEEGAMVAEYDYQPSQIDSMMEKCENAIQKLKTKFGVVT